MDKQKQELNFSEQHPNDLDTDFRFEVIAAALIERGYSPEQIRVVREGIDRRGVSKDVEEVYRRYSPEELMDYLYIKVNREGLFHKSTYKHSYKDIDILEELCTLFFSVNLNVVKEFKIDPADCEFILSDDTRATYQGINSFI